MTKSVIAFMLLIHVISVISFLTCQSFRKHIVHPRPLVQFVKTSDSDLGYNSQSVDDNSIADVIHGWDSSKYQWFLDNYWQKKPLLIRSAIAAEEVIRFKKDDVIFLTSDEDVESRLVSKKRNKRVKTYGPFDNNVLKHLPSANWTVLIQEVDRHVPWVADLWTNYFNFVPLWRRDDVMISYSASGGGIGGHVDNYDVFLIQGSGEKEWSIEHNFLTHKQEFKRELPNSETRLLKDFRADHTWILQPGDMLYLPPRLPHRGVSISNDCVTISMGFRAPSFESLHTAFCQHHCQLSEANNRFYTDATDLGNEYRNSSSSGSSSSSSSSSDTTSNSSNSANKKDSSAMSSSLFDNGLVSNHVALNLADTMRNEMTIALAEKPFLKWLGEYLTAPLRMRMRSPSCFFITSPTSSVVTLSNSDATVDVVKSANDDNGEDLDDGDDDYDYDELEGLPLAVSGPHSVVSTRVFHSVQAVYDAFVKGEISFRRLEGTRMIHCGGELYVDGEVIIISDSNSNNSNNNSDDDSGGDVNTGGGNKSTCSNTKDEDVDDKENYIYFLSNLTRTNVIISRSLSLSNCSYDSSSSKNNKVELLLMLLKKGIFYPVDA